MRKALPELAPAGAFAGGLGLLCYGLSLAWTPLGMIVGGAALAAGAVLHERQQAKSRRITS